MVWMGLVMGLAWGESIPTRTGLHELQLEIDGEPRRLTLVVPERAKKRDRPPLVLALHYGGEVSPHYATAFVQQLVQPGLADLDAVIVAPDCPGEGWTDPTSEAVALAMLDRVAEALGTDPSRTLVTGFSMGGVGAWHFAAAHPERFAVAVPVAGHPGELAETLSVPVHAIHGVRDDVMPVGPTQLAVLAMVGRGIRSKITVDDDLSHYETGRYARLLAGTVEWIRTAWSAR